MNHQPDQLVRDRVFLNYPFDDDFVPYSDALHFGTIAANLIPVCLFDQSTQDTPRILNLFNAIRYSRYSVHDLSRIKGEGKENFSRHNCPIELGMAFFHKSSQPTSHYVAFCVDTPYDYQAAASDLAGLDPLVYECEESLACLCL